jgi:two-component system sensor histidine kinase KdpD
LSKSDGILARLYTILILCRQLLNCSADTLKEAMAHHGPPASGVRRALVPVLRACVVLGAITAVAYRLHLNAAATGFVYLIAVVLNCLDGGLPAAVLVSLVAFCCLDFFFIPPRLTLSVADPVDVAALAAFFTTSIVVSGLAARARAEAVAALRDRRQLERLYELAQRLLSIDPLRFEQTALLEAIRSVFELKAVAFFDGDAAAAHVAGEASQDLADRTRQAFIASQDSTEPERMIAFRRVGPAAKPFGAIGFEGLEDERHAAGAVAALAAASLERGRWVREAARAAAQTQSELLRGAILDALAHEFKTPLAAIITAAGGLIEAGSLRPEQADLADLVEAEAMRLSNLTSHLLRVARLDREDVNVKIEMADIAEAVRGVVARYERQSHTRRIALHAGHVGEEVPLDVDLYQLAVSQLLDNACRYSPPGSTVTITLKEGNGFANLTVWNAGRPIPPEERKMIFERFYRGKEAQATTTGTGLGLHVARKIAAAHGGGLEFDPSQSRDGVAFRLFVPVAQTRRSQHAKAAQNPDCGR